jgi:uroporphyrinogen-III decarboxylase
MSVAAAREKLGKDVCLMGGLDVVSALPGLNRQTLKEEVVRIFKEWKNSGAFFRLPPVPG